MYPRQFLLKWAQAIFFPQSCVLCQERVTNVDLSPLCRDCLASLSCIDLPCCYHCGVPLPGNILESLSSCAFCRSTGYSFNRASAWGLYEGALRQVIKSFKFGRYQKLAIPLAGLLSDCLAASKYQPHWIVPVPMHRRRRRQRGFDQTSLLCRMLSKRNRIPLFTHLRRKRDTPPLFGLSRQKRRKNLRGAFVLRRSHLLRTKKILLVDDILTTGATAHEISCLLHREAAVDRIEVVTIARTPRVFNF